MSRRDRTGILFDQTKAQAAAQSAITGAAGNTGAWMGMAIEAIREVAGSLETFTVDDVQRRLAEKKVARPKEGRAMGSAMKQAATAGIIQSTGRYERSAQVQCHANPRTVWQRAGQKSENP